jgi:RNA polymerase sigma-70 factor (ECF subfamily)
MVAGDFADSAQDRVAGLVVRVASGDRAAFAELYSATSAKLFGTLLRILRTRSEAEDALQEVYTRVWLNARRYDAGKGAGMTWLIAIARNHAIDRLRARPEAASGDDDVFAGIADGKPGAEARLLVLGETKRIVECFGTLDAEHAAAVKGAYLNGLSYQALADRFEVPVNTMRTWLRRSLLKLRECMDR